MAMTHYIVSYRENDGTYKRRSVYGNHLLDVVKYFDPFAGDVLERQNEVLKRIDLIACEVVTYQPWEP